MHELTVVKNIIDIVAYEAEKNGLNQVTEVRLEIGQLSGIEFDSLEFALKSLTPGTILETTEIIIDKPEGIARCNNCGKEFNIVSFAGACTSCNSYDLEIIRGRELRVQSITIE